MTSAFEDVQKPEKWLKFEEMECAKKQVPMLKKKRENTYKINS